MLPGVLNEPHIEELITLFQDLKMGNEEHANQLIESTPSLCNTRIKPLDYTTPLICSVQYEQTIPSLALFKSLVSATENVNNQNSRGFAAIHYLAGYNRATLLKALIENGEEKPVDLNVCNTDGNTPAHLAAYKNAIESLYFLLNQKADPNIANKEGQTPLHKACLMGNAVCVSLLLAAGAKVNQEDNKKRTPIHYLAQSKADSVKKNQILEFLIEYGANINERSAHNKTAYDMAVHFKSEQNFIDSIASKRVPSLFFLCTKTIIKNFNPTESQLKETLPEVIAEHIKNNMSCN